MATTQAIGTRIDIPAKAREQVIMILNHQHRQRAAG